MHKKFFLASITIISILYSCQQESSNRSQASHKRISSSNIKAETNSKNPCDAYGEAYSNALNNSSKEGMNLATKSNNSSDSDSNETKSQLSKLCSNTLDRKNATTQKKESEPPADESETSEKSNTQNFESSESIAQSPETNPDASSSDNLEVKSSDASKGVLGIVDPQPTEPVKAEDVVVSTVETGLEPVVGKEVANAVAGNLGFLTNGLGTGFFVELSEGAGISVSQSVALELVYHRPQSGGEIALYCAPGLGLGFGAGVSGAAGVYFLKSLGCKDSSNYEGPVLDFPLQFGMTKITATLGINAALFMDFLNYLSKSSWSKEFTIQDIDKEMGLVNTKFIQILKNSKNPVEVLTLFIYLFLVNSTIMVATETNDDLDTTNTLGVVKTIPEILETLLKQIISLDVLKANNYSSFKIIFQNFHNKLVPESDFRFSRALLTKLTDSLAGCDALAWTPAILSTPFNLGKFGPSISYSYFINPEFLGSASYDRTRKTILDLDSFKDFASPEEFLDKMKNLFLTEQSNQTCSQWKLIKSSINTPSERTDLVCADGLNLVTEDEENTETSSNGPLSFLKKTAKLASPTYMYSQCLEPTGAHFKEVKDAVAKFFSN